MDFEHYSTRDGSQIDIPIPKSYKDCVDLLKSDYYRIYGRTDNLIIIWFKSFKDRALKHLFWLRLASYHGGLYLLCKLLHEHYKLKYDCQIHAGTKIGWGLYLGHCISMVVNPRCIIGNNVNLSQILNIGTNQGNQAIISNNVYIAPMTCIIEGVHVGENTIIGAGSIVTKDIPPNSTAVGNPCKVISENNHPDYVHNRFNRNNKYVERTSIGKSSR